MAADDFNWDENNGIDDGDNSKKNEDSDEFEKTADHNDSALLDQQMEIPQVEKPSEADDEGDFPFSDIDDALAGVDVPAEPAPEPTADEEQEDPGELTSVSPPPEPESGIQTDEDGMMPLGPDVLERAADVEMYDMESEETLPPTQSPDSPQQDPADQFDPFVPAADKPEEDGVSENLPPPADDEIMELEPEVLVSPEIPAETGAPAEIEIADEPLELDQKSTAPPQPAREDDEEALSLEPEHMAIDEDAGPMGQVSDTGVENVVADEEFMELGSEAMVPPGQSETSQSPPSGSEPQVETSSEPQKPESMESDLQLDSPPDQQQPMTEQPGGEAFVLDEQMDPSQRPAQDGSLEIERNEFGAPQASQPMESEPAAPVEQQDAVQADYTDMVVSNQEFLDIDEPKSEAPPEDTRTKESQNLVDDKDLPHISTEPELVEYTQKGRTGVPDKVLQGDPGIDQPRQTLPEGPETGATPVDEEDSKKFLRPEFTPEPKASKGIPPKMVIFGGIGLAAIIIIAVLFLVVFKGKGGDTAGKDGQQRQQIADGKKPTGLRSQNIKDRRYNKYIKEAKKFYEQGMYDEAEKNVHLALKNKRTPEANNLLKDISQQTQELKKKEEMDKIQKAGEQLLKKTEEKEPEPKVDPEEVDFQDTMKKGTIEAMEAYLAKYTEEARHYFQVYRKLRDLKVESTRNTKQEIKNRGQQLRRPPLRSKYLQLNQLAVEKKIGEMSMVSNQFVSYTIGKDKVIVDYGTGLMWHLWNKPMNAGNSRLFSARRLAGYPNWRLPTVDELYSARRMNLRSLRSSAKARVVVWSGDQDYQGSKTVWAIEFPTGKLIPANPDSTYYLCAVRSIR